MVIDFYPGNGAFAYSVESEIIGKGIQLLGWTDQVHFFVAQDYSFAFVSGDKKVSVIIITYIAQGCAFTADKDQAQKHEHEIE